MNTNEKTNHVNLPRQGTPSPRTASRLSSLRPTQTKSLDPGTWAPMTLRVSTDSTNAVSQSPINQIDPVIHPAKESSSFVPRRDIWTRHVWWVLLQKRYQEMTKNRFKYYLNSLLSAYSLSCSVLHVFLYRFMGMSLKIMLWLECKHVPKLGWISPSVHLSFDASWVFFSRHLNQ